MKIGDFVKILDNDGDMVFIITHITHCQMYPVRVKSTVDNTGLWCRKNIILVLSDNEAIWYLLKQ